MNNSDCRKAVAARWSKVEYRPKRTVSDLDDGSDSSTDIEDGSNARPLKRTQHEVIDLTSASDEETEIPISSDFKLVRSDFYDSSVTSNHLIGFDQIFGDKTLKKSVLFSYQYELDFLLGCFHRDVNEIIIVGQKGTIMPPTQRMALANRLSIIEFSMPQFTCHHSKMIINYYDDNSCRIFMPSNNFTYAEANYPQQVCWCSPKLKRSQDAYVPGVSAFQDSLLEYLNTYKQRDIQRRVIASVETIDFKPLQDVIFMFSAPSSDTQSGFQRLANALSEDVCEESGDKVHHYLCQTSSIGAALSKQTHANLFTHVFIPNLHGITTMKSKLLSTQELISEFKARRIVPHVVYPTVEEIRASPLGWFSCGWFHFNYSKNMTHYNILAKDFGVFRKQDPSRVSKERRATPSHSKFYMKFTTTPGTQPASSINLDWCLYTSSNLSRNAWGTGGGRPRNYEVGVLLKSGARDLICGSFTDVIYQNSSNLNPKSNSQIVLVPFTIPLVPYDDKQADEAFCMSKDYTLTDVNGLSFPHH